MNPVLRDGDRVEASSLQRQDLSPGRLLVYRRDGEEIVVHRLMALEVRDGKTHYFISPDTAPLCTEKVDQDRVLGVVQRVFRGEKEIFLDRGWRFWWGRLLTRGFRYPWILRILFRLGHFFLG